MGTQPLAETTRPLCRVCRTNVAEPAGWTKQNGTPAYRYRCSSCRKTGRRAAMILCALFLAGCASGPRLYSFEAHQVRGATKLLNRSGAEAKPYIDTLCTPAPTEPTMRGFCRATRALYRLAFSLADGVDDAMNAADAKNAQAVDLDKVLEVGFRLLDLATEEEAAARLAMEGVPR